MFSFWKLWQQYLISIEEYYKVTSLTFLLLNAFLSQVYEGWGMSPPYRQWQMPEIPTGSNVPPGALRDSKGPELSYCNNVGFALTYCKKVLQK